MNAEYHAPTPAGDCLQRARPRHGFAVALAMLLAGCSSGMGDSNNPPDSPSPPPPPPPAPATVSGLDARPSNTTCVAPERATGSTEIGTERVFPNLKFTNQPVAMVQVPGDSSRWFVPGRLGTV